MVDVRDNRDVAELHDCHRKQVKAAADTSNVRPALIWTPSYSILCNCERCQCRKGDLAFTDRHDFRRRSTLASTMDQPRRRGRFIAKARGEEASDIAVE